MNILHLCTHSKLSFPIAAISHEPACVRQDIGKRIKTTYMFWPNAKNCLHNNEEVVFIIAESTFLLPQDKQS